MKLRSAVIVLAVVIMITLPVPALSQTNQPPMDNFALVTNLWYNGYKSNVLAIAEQRLAANTNDLAGLVIIMEFNLAFSNDSCLSNDIFRVLSAAEPITNSNIRTHFTEMKGILEDFLQFLKDDYHPTAAELEEERGKAYIIHKRMTYERYLKWLHDDGLF